jgi:U3 small nucleolar RNA-associated protein 16
MFAHLVTAAKGLFTRHPEEQHSHSADSITLNSNMVTSTRRGDVATDVAANGKRKDRPASAGKADGQDTKKKRRRSNPRATDTSADAANGTLETSNVNEAKAPAGKKIRFGSEEPEPIIETQPEETSESPKEDEEDEDSDDDAPETIVNSAQLLKMKEHAKKQEAAKQLYV